MTAMDKNEMAQANPFKDLNLIALRQHACPKASKNNEWYLSCIDCPDNRTCGVGRRVNEILEKTTKPEKSPIEKFSERLKKKEKLDMEARFREALKQPDPLKWLVENGYYANRTVASNNYYKFQARHPEFPRLLSESTAIKRNCEKKADEAVKNIRNLFEGCPKDEMLKRYLTKGIAPERSIDGAASKFGAWCKKYPDLAEEFGLGSILPELNKIRTGNKTKSVGEVLKKMGMEQKQEADEISLEDFLKENGTETKEKKELEKPAVKFRLKPEDISEEQARDIVGMSDNVLDQAILRRIFGQKRLDLKARIGREEQNLRDLQAEIERLKEQIRTLDETALMFGLAATDGSGKEVSA